jgi:hypothetical protein
MNRILITAAVREELAGFRPPAVQARCLITGMGRERAVEAVRRCLKREPFRLVVSAGFAGGTRSGLKVGDLVIASEVIDVASGARRQPDQAVLGSNGSAFVGPIVTVDTLLADPAAKAKIGARYGAVAVEMETAAIAELAQRHHIPWGAVRVILDPMEVPVSIRSRWDGVGCLLRPLRWGALSRFVGDIRLAAHSLGRGLDKLIAAQAVEVSKGAAHSSPRGERYER